MAAAKAVRVSWRWFAASRHSGYAASYRWLRKRRADWLLASRRRKVRAVRSPIQPSCGIESTRLQPIEWPLGTGVRQSEDAGVQRASGPAARPSTTPGQACSVSDRRAGNHPADVANRLVRAAVLPAAGRSPRSAAPARRAAVKLVPKQQCDRDCPGDSTVLDSENNAIAAVEVGRVTRAVRAESAADHPVSWSAVLVTEARPAPDQAARKPVPTRESAREPRRAIPQPHRSVRLRAELVHLRRAGRGQVETEPTRVEDDWAHSARTTRPLPRLPDRERTAARVARSRRDWPGF